LKFEATAYHVDEFPAFKIDENAAEVTSSVARMQDDDDEVRLQPIKEQLNQIDCPTDAMTFHQTHKKPTINTPDNERFTLLFYLRKRGRTPWS
jgi:hypothetical protein